MGWLVAAATALPFVVGSLVGSPAGPQGRVAFTFADPDIVESSGLVVAGGLAVTMNDSGDSARVFTVDTGTGETVGTTTWDADVTDLESLAPVADGTGDVLVGDTGGNLVDRDTVTLYRLPVGEGTTVADTVPAVWRYPDGDQDAEALLVQPGTDRFLLVSKGVFAGTAYQGTLNAGGGRGGELTDVGTVIPMVTDGAFFPDGEHLVLRDYQQAEVYTWPDLEPVADFPLPDQPQGEGIAVAPDGRVYVSSEGDHSEVLEVRLPERVKSVVEPAGDRSGGPAAAIDVHSGATDSDPPAQSVGEPWLWAGGGVGVVAVAVGVWWWRARRAPRSSS